MKGVAEHDVRTPLHLEVLIHILTDHFKFAILDVGKLVKDKVGVVSAEVVEEHGDPVIDRPLKITLLMSSGDKPPRHIIVITHFGFSWFVFSFERLAKNKAVSCIVKGFLLSARKPISRDVFFNV